ncbi:MAG: hypothetical protein JWQ01_2050 [Massilia sp.]|nr:hypothetical protein [Massilia sp.]
MNSRRRGKVPIDPGMAHLLELNGTIQSQTVSGYWIKIEARRVKTSSARPFGLKYSLTLHAPAGQRLTGFDNAHSIKTEGYCKVRPAWDHFHRHTLDEPMAYEYRGADQLLSDFFNEVKRVLEEVNHEQNH